MHRLAQFDAINRAAGSASEAVVDPPEPGNLPADLLTVLCAALSEHTSTPDSCWFGLWEGHGWVYGGVRIVEFSPLDTIVPAATSLVEATDSLSVSSNLLAAMRDAPRVHLPGRNYLLFEGPVDAATELGWSMPSGGFAPQSPNLFWPHDHAWCVASEIDLFCTLVAGSQALAETLISDPRLEVWPVFPDDPITWDSDDINT